MRALAIAFLVLAACDRNSGQSDTAANAQPAALTYDGADYKTDAQKIAHGERLATVLDCTGCHGANLQGTDLNDDPKDDAMYAPNVTLLLGEYSDAGLDQLIRQGKPKDGREFWFMPVESYQFLSDADFNALIAYLRTIKPAGKALPPFTLNRAQLKDIDAGNLGNSQAQIQKYRATPPAEMGAQHGWGRYIVRTTCTQCHNSALQGWPNFTPDLDIAGTYSKAELTALLTDGKSKTGKDIGMSGVARRNFSKLTAREREAIVDYVLARANRPQQPQ